MRSDLRLAGESRDLLGKTIWRLTPRLIEDILFIMAGYGLWDLVDNKYQANDMTKYMVSQPSSIHGALHLWVVS